MVVDKRLDYFREEADRGRGIVPIARAVRDPPARTRGEAVPRAHLFRVDSRDAEPGNSPFDEVLKEPIARLGLFALDEVAGLRLQLDGSVQLPVVVFHAFCHAHDAFPAMGHGPPLSAS